MTSTGSRSTGTRRRPSPLGVAGVALGLFLAVFALLAFQLRAQSHPAVAAAPAPARRVLQRRVIVRKVIVVIRREDGRGGAAPAPAVVQVSGPAPAVPAVSAPAPAPAPAPLVTRTS